MSWIWGSTTNPQFEELAEKACSPLHLPYPQSEDIATSLEVADMIRSKSVQPKIAMQSLKRRIASKNGRVQMYALGLTDTCIKNGGDHFLAEIASKEFVDELSGLIKSPITNAEVKQMLLKVFQQWALAFQSKKELAFFVDVYNELKNSGISFPPPPAPIPSHLLTTSTAPAWVDSDVCMRCRTAFTFTNRKHHCRNCGLVFDQACSSRTMPIPRFGITEEVRVCESCWVKSGKGKTPDGPAPAVPGRTPRSRADVDADLQRAIELSLAESQPGGSNFIGSEPPIARKNATAEEDDEDLRLAIEASLRDMERARPSAPTGYDEPEYKPLPTFDLAPRETETILTFSNTMDQMAAYGERDLRRFPHAHILAEQAYSLGEKLHRNAEEKSTKQQMLAEMQGKLSEAVSLYGQILDGQQAYSARRIQEEQQRRYQQNQSMYAYASPQQQNPYSYVQQTYPTANGYGQYNPQTLYQPPQPQAPAHAAPSLYPQMPLQAAATPQTNYAQTQQIPYRPETISPHPVQPVQQYYNPQAQSSLARHPSLNSQLVSSPSAPHRQVSVTYGSAPTSVAIDTTQQQAPPVPTASHPPSSPPTSLHSVAHQASAPPAPSSQGSYKSPAPLHNQLDPQPQWNAQPSQPPQQQWNGVQEQQQQQQPQQSYQQGSYAPSQAIQQSYEPYPQVQPPQQQQQSAQHTQQHQQQIQQSNGILPSGVYNVNSFPSAPGQIFPDAPSEIPLKTVEKEEKEEALLIEL
ncbi:uncharacterized protein I206_105541 [Kwoniella pini CBS 10737]|uniref:Vacuolar protein sorting-associated protein 27 n=1 Tax=Kwoniella pini CBS 10737 TaxID=1296096 RepID=A0A1B9I3Z4_9TREE|nr:vacuolar protein sorting-associated protein 27 [Kwoniella pini CBS 10737]OCF50237.1 vacuolar protein sorting-associated protein 27 [Kwoniella pini CBS 10737]